MKKIYHILYITFFALVLSSCAILPFDTASRAQYNIPIQSTPPGVNFKVVNEEGDVVYSGRAPEIINVEASDGYYSGANYTIEFSKPGYKDKKVEISPNVDGWSYPLFFLFIRRPVDGSHYSYKHLSERKGGLEVKLDRK